MWEKGSPVMTDIDYGGIEVTAVNDEVSPEGGTPGKAACPDCNKLLTITAAGELRKHKCVNDIPTTRTGASHKGPAAKRPRTPSSVRNLGVALIGAGVEYTAAASVSRWVECPASEVPADLGDDADIMIGPVLDAIWPRLPKRGQRVIKALADESDLIMAAMAWYEWGRTLKTWGDRHIATKAAAEKPTRGFTDGVQISESLNGDGGPLLGSLTPFTPDTVSG
jgi:hypothetical protein